MPRIPIYQQQNVPNGASLPANLSPSNTGAALANVGQGLRQVAGAQDNVAEMQHRLDMQRLESEARINSASLASQFDLQMREYMASKQATAGDGAPEFTPNMLKDYDEQATKMLDDAPNDRARELLRMHVATSREGFGAQALSFEATERARNYGKKIETGLDAAQKLVYGSPESFDRQMAMWGETIDATPVNPEARAALKDIKRGKLAWSSVTGMIDRNPQHDVSTSSAWNALTADEQTKARHYQDGKRREFETQKMAGVFIDAANGVIDNAPMLSRDTVNLPAAKAAAVAAVKKQGVTLNPEQQLQLENQVERAAADKERDMKRRTDASTANLFAQLDKNGGDYQALLKANPWISRMDTAYQQRVNEYAGVVATGGTRATNWQLYGSLMKRPDTLMATNLDAMADKFNAKELEQLKTLQHKLLTDPGASQDMISDHALIKGTMEQAGVKSDKDQAQFFSLLQAKINRELAVTGKKKLPQSDIVKFTNELLAEVPVHRKILWDTTSQAWKAPIPEAQRIKYESALAVEGLPTDEATVRELWLRDQEAQK